MNVKFILNQNFPYLRQCVSQDCDLLVTGSFKILTYRTVMYSKNVTTFTFCPMSGGRNRLYF